MTIPVGADFLFYFQRCILKGIIIAGGLGTRLRPLTYGRPKPLVSVANRPFLEYQVALLKKYGVDDIVFATNYMADKIEAHFEDGSRFGVKMRYAIEDQPLGTGGAIRNAADVFPGETVAVFNGDVLTDFDLGKIISFHQERGSIATITLSEVPSPHPFGIVILDERGKVLEWREPSEESKKALSTNQDVIQTGTDFINAGFYILGPECIERIPQGKPASIERDIYPRLIADKAPIYGIAPGGFWMDVGRAEQLLIATQSVLSGAVNVATPGKAVGEGTTIASDAKVNELTAIGKNCLVGNESVLENVILMDGVKVGNRVKLGGVIVDEGTVIEDEVVITVRSGSGGLTPVIAAGSVLCKGTRLQM